MGEYSQIPISEIQDGSDGAASRVGENVKHRKLQEVADRDFSSRVTLVVVFSIPTHGLYGAQCPAYPRIRFTSAKKCIAISKHL